MFQKGKFILAGAFLALVAVLLLSPTPTTVMANGDVIPGEYIIVLDNTAHAANVANEMAQTHSLRLQHVYSGHALNGFSATVPDGRLKALQNDPRVVSITPNQFLTISHCTPGHPQHCSDPTPTPPPGGNQTIPTGILRINGDLSSTASGDGSGSVNVDVAVIDTGVDIDHPDLNVVGGINCSNGPSNRYDDGNGHGTHVAGTIGALDNDSGVVGVAPGARIWAVRVLNSSGSGSTADVICGIDWVTSQASVIEVANMSLGGPGGDSSCNADAFHQAICNSVSAGVTHVVAAGNSADDSANYTPAAYDQVITVSALADFDGEPGGNGSPTCRSDEDDTFANFSNYGADVDIIAPGVCIESTWRGGGYNTISGTSMASPHVAGAAALYKANNPGASPAQVQNALQNAGNSNWDNSDDGDNIKEPLLDVGGF